MYLRVTLIFKFWEFQKSVGFLLEFWKMILGKLVSDFPKVQNRKIAGTLTKNRCFYYAKIVFQKYFFQQVFNCLADEALLKTSLI